MELNPKAFLIIRKDAYQRVRISQVAGVIGRTNLQLEPIVMNCGKLQVRLVNGLVRINHQVLAFD